jgi:hypothetical protein
MANVDPNNFDYNLRLAQAIERQKQGQKALDQNLATPLDGQMVSGRYVAPSWTQGLAKALSGYFSMKGIDEARAEQSKLSDDSAAALAKYLGQYQDAQNGQPFIDAAKANNTAPSDQYTYKDPNAVGPTMDQLNGVQTSPVAPQDAAPQALDSTTQNYGGAVPGYPAGAPMSPADTAMVAPGAGGGRGGQGGPTAAELQGVNAPAGASGNALAAAMNRSVLQGIRDNVRPQDRIPTMAERAQQRPPVMPQQVIADQPSPALQQPTPMPAQGPQAGPALPQATGQAVPPQAAPSANPDFNITPVTPEAKEAYVNSVLGEARKAQQAQQMQAILGMGRAGGDTGKALSGALLAQTVGTKPTYEKLGEGDKLYKMGPNGPVLVADGGPSTKALTATLKAQSDAREGDRNDDKFAFDAAGKVNEARTKLDATRQVADKAERAVQLLSKYAPTGGVWSNAYGAIARTVGNDQANEIDMALKDLAFGDLKQSFGGNPTEGERKAQLDVKASIEKGLAPSQNSLNVLLKGYRRQADTQQKDLDTYTGIYDQYRTRKAPQKQLDPTTKSLVDEHFPARR